LGANLSVVEEARRGVDEAEAQKLAAKLKRGKGFDLEDFRGQIQQMQKMGGLASLVDKLPAQLAQAAASSPRLADGRALARIEGIINSMTPAERAAPELIKASRKRRIAAGAGVPVQEVNRLLNQFGEMQKMMKQMQKGGLARMLRAMKGLVPPGPR
jgi:signal recognition particle subunit SRP54